MSEVDILRAAMREIYEVWAGSEGFDPVTAPEACQQALIEEMRDIAAKHLAVPLTIKDGIISFTMDEYNKQFPPGKWGFGDDRKTMEGRPEETNDLIKNERVKMKERIKKQRGVFGEWS